jgi:hypothetical protein
VKYVTIGEMNGKVKVIDIKSIPVKTDNFDLSLKHQDVDPINNYNFIFTGFIEKWTCQ